MTALLWAMVRARRGLAVITLLLTALAAAAAAAGPLYQEAAAVSLRGVEVAAATVDERVVTAQTGDDPRGGDQPLRPYVPGMLTLSGISAQVVVTGDQGEEGQQGMFLATRTGICEHLTIVKGRCATGEREVVLREDAGAELGAQPGQDLEFRAPPAGSQDPEPPAAVRLTVVGFYQAVRLDDPYWGDREILTGLEQPAAFATERTVAAVDGSRMRMVDLLVTPSAFDDMDRLRDDLDDAESELDAGGFGVDSELNKLIARIEDGESQLASSLLLAAVPLVMLCWLVLFIAVAGGVEQRRGELGLTALRGVPARTRWWLATAETSVPVLVAVIPGYLLGYALTALLATIVLPGSPPVYLNPASALYTAAAVLGALLAGLLAQVRALTTPVLGLLRRARVRRRGGLVGGIEAMVGALALVAGYQVAAGEDAGAGGIGLLAPLCIALGLGLVAARAIGVPAERLGRRALRRGRLRTGLAALTLARGGGTHWVVVLLTVVFGLLGFALSARDVAAQAWHERAQVQVGAARVLQVESLPAASLLHAVRTADPAGRYAMAAMRVNVNSETKLLAVDSSRFAAVALWPDAYGATTPAEVARQLRPAEVTPLALTAAEVEITVTLDRIEPGAKAGLTLRLVGTGGAQSSVRVDKLLPGTHAYRVATPACAAGPCQVRQLLVDLFTPKRYLVDLTVGDLRDPTGKTVLTGAELAGHHWRLPQTSAARPVPEMAPAAGGLRVWVDNVLTPDMRASADPAPDPLPLVAAGELPPELLGAGGTVRVPITRAGTLPLVPRYGAHGALVDLQYADLRVGGEGDAQEPEVWLSADAPADLVKRLEANGLKVLGERDAAGQLHLYQEQAPALALLFLAAAALTGVLFAAGGLLITAVLERGRADGGLAVLRGQGVRERVLRDADLGGRFALVLAGTVIGLLAAVLSWALARGVLPVFGDGGTAVPPPDLPGPLVAAPIAAALLVLLTTCLLATRVARGSEGATS
ncbi:FtsX-like permease family protein [Catellatospora sichuanensis]|uniref:FtsX-like permease family protein n=1 Tax=Catellatospora sichuanensis TaxID=1969805 RepID=UPI001642DBC2|nr:FtsX-like permease family protein [Catellatospora sichuanensis]